MKPVIEVHSLEELRSVLRSLKEGQTARIFVEYEEKGSRQDETEIDSRSKKSD